MTRALVALLLAACSSSCALFQPKPAPVELVCSIPSALLIERQEPVLTGAGGLLGGTMPVITWRDVGEYCVRVRDWGEAEARDRARVRALIGAAATSK